MSFYLGVNKYKIKLNGVTYKVIVEGKMIGDRLLSSDNYILRDRNGIYLMPKVEIEGTLLTMSDNTILCDSNGMYITVKEEM